MQSLTRRGQVHVFGLAPSGIAQSVLPKNGPDPDFAIVLRRRPVVVDETEILLETRRFRVLRRAQRLPDGREHSREVIEQIVI